MMTVKLLSLCLLLGLFHSSWATRDKCHDSDISSCQQCIQKAPECAWCTDDDRSLMIRCHTLQGMHMVGCAEAYIYHPQGSVQVVTNLSRAGKTEGQPAFLQPQEVNITLRPGPPQSFNLTVFLPKDQLTSKLTMDSSSIPEGVKITYTTISTQNPQVIQVNVELTQCPGEKNHNNTESWTVHITPRDSSPSLDLQLTLECSCDCMDERKENSHVCNGRGALECGGCECNRPYFGSRCQSQPDFNRSSDGGACRHRGGAVCSGRGDCVDGECHCYRENPTEHYTGMYCECSKYDCPRFGTRLCGGHGTCECGQCICDPMWAGDDCSCSLNTTSCLASNGELCNERGSCDCGVCRCTDSHYRGPTCEECPNCPGMCAELKGCVECLVHGAPPEGRCEGGCSHLNVTMVNRRHELPSGSHCTETDDWGCTFYYTIRPDNGLYHVTAARAAMEDCPIGPGQDYYLYGGKN